jgi:DNA-directed RNA polymerase
MDLQDQLELETLMVEEGINRYRKQLTEAMVNKAETMMTPQRFFMVNAIKPLASAIKELVESTYNGKPGKKSISISYLRDTDPETVAYITSKTILNCLSSEGTVNTVAIRIGQNIEDHIVLTKFKTTNPDFFKRATKKVSKFSIEHYQAKCMKNYTKIAGIERPRFKHDAKLILGTALIKIFEQVTGLIEVRTISLNKPTLIKATPKAMEQLKELHSRCELMNPVYMPMVIKPAPWSTPTNGGYVTQRLPLIKTRNTGYLEELQHVSMPEVYRSINAMQETPWRLNKRVYEVLLELWKSSSTLAGLPSREIIELNPLPGGLPEDSTKETVKEYRDNHKEEWEQFKVERKRIRDSNNRRQSKIVALLKIINCADRLKNYEQFWFPYQMDWRGRMYPVVGVLNPQGQDAAKGLLEFAEGKPLGETGLTWLRIHLANCFGVDKVSYEDRILWTMMHEEQIKAVANDPLGNLFWTEADGGGKAWQFLAACFAYADYLEHGADYPCHLPVSLDGSCNGLQHLSALALDSYGAINTNLVDAQKPADIYQTVADAVAHDVAEDAKNGNELAMLWQGKIKRSVVKRNVMTVSYGATKYGMLEQLKEDLHKATDGKFREWLGVPDGQQDFDHLKYLSELIIKHIGTTVEAAPKVMGWLMECAHVVSENGLPVRWTTPVGLPVMQSYRNVKERRLDTTVGNYRVRTLVYDPLKKQNTRRNALGISPNVIHSFDAAHMMATVNGMLDAGITGFAMVHDSYGTHACDVQEMAITLREKFIEMYEVDQLARFRQQLVDQVPTELADRLPAPLVRGDFDLEQVREALYFFA